jgi:hypothetical protein
MKPLFLLVTVILLSPLAAHAQCDNRGLLGVLDINATACAEEPARAPASLNDQQAPDDRLETAGDIAGLDDDATSR